MSFGSKYQFFKAIDGLPSHDKASWIYDTWEVVGDLEDEHGNKKKERIELWMRNSLECIAELVAKTIFGSDMHWAPERHFIDDAGNERAFHEMWTGNWWWNLQGKLALGAAIAALLLSSDKTHLTNYSGDKVAWPLYGTLGNIPKHIRRQSSKHATMLLAYLPVVKLDCFSTAEKRSNALHQIFHRAMRTVLAPLIKAGQDGQMMTCSDGCIRRIHPIVAAYIADHPEQCLISGCKENWCPKCEVNRDLRETAVHHPLRDPTAVKNALAMGSHSDQFKNLGLRELEPFWTDLPHCNIFQAIAPDMLHQLHKGVFKDHLVNWVTQTLHHTSNNGERELDERFKAMISHPELRHFKKGISSISQWTGTEYKHMQKVFIGAIAGGVDPEVIRPARAVVDFIYYAHFAVQTQTSLECLDSAWKMFHETKSIFVNLGIREHFNIPKLHSMSHYVASIQMLGTTDGTNTENSERSHIDFVKVAYRASNKKDFTSQMTKWLDRQNKIHDFEAFLSWAEPIRVTAQPFRENLVSDYEGNDDDDGQAEPQEDEDEDDEDDEDEDEDEELTDFLKKTHKVAKTPKQVSVGTLRNTHNLTDFHYYLENYLH